MVSPFVDLTELKLTCSEHPGHTVFKLNRPSNLIYCKYVACQNGGDKRAAKTEQKGKREHFVFNLCSVHVTCCQLRQITLMMRRNKGVSLQLVHDKL